MASYASLWCCVKREPQGHVWYDLLWDWPGGHKDRHGRAWNGTWFPIMGP